MRAALLIGLAHSQAMTSNDRRASASAGPPAVRANILARRPIKVMSFTKIVIEPRKRSRIAPIRWRNKAVPPFLRRGAEFTIEARYAQAGVRRGASLPR